MGCSLIAEGRIKGGREDKEANDGFFYYAFGTYLGCSFGSSLGTSLGFYLAS
jgi:hypothetical protein